MPKEDQMGIYLRTDYFSWNPLFWNEASAKYLCLGLGWCRRMTKPLYAPLKKDTPCGHQLQILDSLPFQEIKDGWKSVALEFAPETRGEVSFMDEHSIIVDYMEVVRGSI